MEHVRPDLVSKLRHYSFPLQPSDFLGSLLVLVDVDQVHSINDQVILSLSAEDFKGYIDQRQEEDGEEEEPPAAEEEEEK